MALYPGRRDPTVQGMHTIKNSQRYFKSSSVKLQMVHEVNMRHILASMESKTYYYDKLGQTK